MKNVRTTCSPWIGLIALQLALAACGPSRAPVSFQNIDESNKLLSSTATEDQDTVAVPGTTGGSSSSSDSSTVSTPSTGGSNDQNTSNNSGDTSSSGSTIGSGSNSNSSGSDSTTSGNDSSGGSTSGGSSSGGNSNTETPVVTNPPPPTSPGTGSDTNTSSGGTSSGGTTTPNTPTYVLKNQTLDVGQNNKVDIVFIIDNSGSMGYEQSSMAARMSSMVQQLQGLDWRVGIITTDGRNTVSWGDGKLLPLSAMPTRFSTTKYVLDSSEVSVEEAQRIIGATLQRPEVGSGTEQPIRGLYRFIEQANDTNVSSPASGFFREGAHFTSIVISDEDESATTLMNQPSELIAKIQNTWNSQKNFVFHAIIAKPDDASCANKEGNGSGAILKQMAELSGVASRGGAIIGSVCATDYGSQLAGIGQSIVEMRQTFTLTCAPSGTDQNIIIKKDGAVFTESFRMEGLKLTFDQPLPAGHYEFAFYCQE